MEHPPVICCRCPSTVLSSTMKLHSIGKKVWHTSHCRVAHQGSMQAWGWCTRYSKVYQCWDHLHKPVTQLISSLLEDVPPSSVQVPPEACVRHPAGQSRHSRQARWCMCIPRAQLCAQCLRPPAWPTHGSGTAAPRQSGNSWLPEPLQDMCNCWLFGMLPLPSSHRFRAPVMDSAGPAPGPEDPMGAPCVVCGWG